MVRVAIIGAGVMGADHAQIIAGDIPGATLHVVCDASADRAKAVADACGAAHVDPDPMAAVTREEVDAVLVASPDDTHADLTLAALQAGKAVLCEKPLAPNTADCLKIIEAEVAQGARSVTVGFMRRFDPAYQAMKAARTGGTLGKAVMMHNFHRNVEAPSFFTGQMAISNSAPHEFDIARFVLGGEFAAITAFQGDSGGPVAPVVMVLETQNGQLVTIEVNNNAAYGYDVRGELVCATGSVDLGAPVHARVNADLRAATDYAADWRPRFAEAYRLQNKAWIESIQTGTPNADAATAWDGYCATLVAEAGVASLASGARASIKPVARPHLYAHDEETG